MNAIRQLLTCLLLITGVSQATAQQGWGRQRQPVGGYIINGRHHQQDCSCATCVQLRTSAQKEEPPKVEPKVEAPPPAPVDPDDQPAVKTDVDVAKPVTTKADVIKSIRSNQNLSQEAKAEAIAGLTTPQFEMVSNNASFDLLSALKSGSKTAAVKADVDVTPAPKPPAPKVEAPAPKPPAPKVEAPAPKVEPKAPAPKPTLLLQPANPPRPAGPPSAPPAPKAFALSGSEVDDKYEVPETSIGMTVGARINLAESWEQGKPVSYGKMVQFWVKPSAKRPEKLKSVAYNWTVLPREEVVTWHDTTRIIFSTGVKPQTYIVMLTASYVYLDDDKIIQRTAQAVSMLQVGESAGPTGGLPPVNLEGLAKQAYEWTALVSRTNDYGEAEVKADAKRLATSFSTVAKKIKDGLLTDQNDIFVQSKTSNDGILGDAKSSWLPWFMQMTEMLKAAYKDNAIRTPAQYAVAWEEIARGLEAAGR